jgi:hypothetical protein
MKYDLVTFRLPPFCYNVEVLYNTGIDGHINRSEKGSNRSEGGEFKNFTLGN